MARTRAILLALLLEMSVFLSALTFADFNTAITRGKPASILRIQETFKNTQHHSCANGTSQTLRPTLHVTSQYLG